MVNKSKDEKLENAMANPNSLENGVLCEVSTGGLGDRTCSNLLALQNNP